MVAKKFVTYYLCCEKQKKAFYKKKIKENRRTLMCFTDLLSECDKVLVVGRPDPGMEKKILQAKLSGIGIETLDEKLLTQAQKVELTKNAPERESGYSSRNRTREYEL